MNPARHPWPPRPPHPSPVPRDWPVGCVIPYAGPVADSDAGGTVDLAQIRAMLSAAGWLYCDGSPYACADHLLLFGVIGSRFGSATADGVAQFCVPDLRGRFIRGVDVKGGIDPGDRKTPDGTTSFEVGTEQADAFQGHEHTYISSGGGLTVTMTAGAAQTNTIGPIPDTSTTGILVDPSDNGQSDGAPRSSTETRPVNIALNYLIRWA